MNDYLLLEVLLSTIKFKRTIVKIERCKETIFCYNNQIAYIKGDINIMVDYMAKLITKTNHV